VSTNDVREVIIIGGPAGYTAASMRRARTSNPLVIEGFAWGGQLMITSDVENYPATRRDPRPEMMQDFRKQAERFGTEFITDDVTRVDFSERPFGVWVGDTEYRAESVIIATGANARQLGLESEKTLQGRGVSYCAVCDAAFFKDREVSSSAAGFRDGGSHLLAKFAPKVTVVHRRDSFRASPIMVDRARSSDRIEFLLDSVVEDVLGTDGAASPVSSSATSRPARRRNSRPTASSSPSGTTRTRRSSVASLDMDEAGYIITKDRSTETNIPGVFAAGDVQDHVYRQAVTAAGPRNDGGARRRALARSPARPAGGGARTPRNW
jgi:thioredoxin reductase (NADPH)